MNIYNYLFYKWKYLFWVILLIGYASNTYAITYYVDYSSGADADSGLSASTPWKHCPGDINATSNSAGTILTGGDVVIFKGGVNYYGAITVKWSGSSSSSLITYDGNSRGTWGIGQAIMNGNSKTYIGAFTAISKSYFKIVGFEMTDYSARGVETEGCSYFTVKDCYIHRIADWNLSACGGTTPCDMSYVMGKAGVYGGAGISITQSFSNVVIDNVNITRTKAMGIGVYNAYGTGLEIMNSQIHDYINWAIDFNPQASKTISNSSIHDNKFYGEYHYSSDYWYKILPSELVNPGTGENPHQDGIFVRNPSGGIISNLRIYNNDFFENINFTGAGTTAKLYISQTNSGDTIYVYNNTFQGCYAYYCMSALFLISGDIHIYNNTFYMQRMSALRFMVSSSSSNTNIYLKNNIFDLSVSGDYAIYTDDSYARNRIKSDYNVFRKGSGNLFSGYANLSNWQSATGQDKSSTQITTNLFIEPHGMETSGTSNLKLLGTATDAINKGIDLSTIFNTDHIGTPRPQGGVWDIGAYEAILLSLRPPALLNIN